MDPKENLSVRAGCKDVWNAFMLQGASFSENDIPLCPTTANEIPSRLISYEEAKHIHNCELERGNANYKVNAFVHFYIDDQGFDGKRTSIWTYPDVAEKVLCHYDGIIAPDFSTYLDFPDPLKRWNYYRMNSFGYWYGSTGHQVYCNARWGAKDTWNYSFDGIRYGDPVAIGTVASGLRRLVNRPLFEEGLFELVARKHPPFILVYGSANYKCFDAIREQGVKIISFPSQTSEAYLRRKSYE